MSFSLLHRIGHNGGKQGTRYIGQICNSGFANTVYSLLLNGKSRDHKQTHTWYLPQGNFPSEIETRSLSFSTLLVWRSHICITSLTALRFFD
ncbi:hypothetical protein N7501_010047 [Penicillium viridicatum]|nr:hypothetical protein N7501_010047 [Penicillium viridicatum]